MTVFTDNPSIILILGADREENIQESRISTLNFDNFWLIGLKFLNFEKNIFFDVGMILPDSK